MGLELFRAWPLGDPFCALFDSLPKGRRGGGGSMSPASRPGGAICSGDFSKASLRSARTGRAVLGVPKSLPNWKGRVWLSGARVKGRALVERPLARDKDGRRGADFRRLIEISKVCGPRADQLTLEKGLARGTGTLAGEQAMVQRWTIQLG